MFFELSRLVVGTRELLCKIGNVLKWKSIIVQCFELPKNRRYVNRLLRGTWYKTKRFPTLVNFQKPKKKYIHYIGYHLMNGINSAKINFFSFSLQRRVFCKSNEHKRKQRLQKYKYMLFFAYEN